MASGVGSASMNAAALTSLTNIYPSMSTTLEAFAGCPEFQEITKSFGL